MAAEQSKNQVQTKKHSLENTNYIRFFFNSCSILRHKYYLFPYLGNACLILYSSLYIKNFHIHIEM